MPKCKGKTAKGKDCSRSPSSGGSYCSSHGGKSPSPKKRGIKNLFDMPDYSETILANLKTDEEVIAFCNTNKSTKTLCENESVWLKRAIKQELYDPWDNGYDDLAVFSRDFKSSTYKTPYLRYRALQSFKKNFFKDGWGGNDNEWLKGQFAKEIMNGTNIDFDDITVKLAKTERADSWEEGPTYNASCKDCKTLEVLIKHSSFTRRILSDLFLTSFIDDDASDSEYSSQLYNLYLGNDHTMSGDMYDKVKGTIGVPKSSDRR